ncbi:MAG: CHAT domain-containing protein, partial [Thainema sp.]
TLGNIGNVNGLLGNYPTALDYYEQNLVITREIGDRVTEAKTLGNIGRLLDAQSQPELAIVFLKEAINGYEGIRDSNRTLDTELQESYTATIEDKYRTLAELLLQQDRILEAQEVLDLLKLQELDDYLRDIRRGSDTPVQQLDFWPAEQAILDLYNQQLQADSSFSFTDFINSTAVTQQVEQLRRTATGQNLNPDQLARLQDNLQQAGNAALLYPLILDDKIELVLVTTSGLIRETVPVDRVELNRVITDFRRDITNPRSEPTANAQKLYQWLIAPIAQQLEQADADTILYAADGTLRYIPLAALHNGEQWLTQQYTINHITAASLTDFRRDRTTNLNILAGAFPADAGYSVEVNGESRFYQGLPAAKAEVETIQADIPSTNALFDQQFNLAAVVPQLSDYSIVHFATHAQFVSGFPHESFILFGNGERVTLRDIGEWSLPNAELVVLSACETAVSEGLGNGEEILGFGYQMQRIGVEAAIASLWSVSDGGTQVLMNEFYNALNQGMGKAEALQLAQSALVTGEFTAVGNTRGDDGRIVAISTATGLPTSVSNNLDHPYYWAPFILIGNGL